MSDSSRNAPPAKLSGPPRAWLVFAPLLAVGFVLHYSAGSNAEWLTDLTLLLLTGSGMAIYLGYLLWSAAVPGDDYMPAHARA